MCVCVYLPSYIFLVIVYGRDRVQEYARERGEGSLRNLEQTRRECQDRVRWKLFCRGHPLVGAPRSRRQNEYNRNNYIDIDPHTYLHSANNRRTRNTHNQTYQTYYANTDSYKHSYFPRTIRDWNRLPQSILNSNTIDSFTKQLHIHLSSQHPSTNTHT